MQVVILIVGRATPPETLRGTHWVQALWAIYIGMAGPLMALVVGQHTAISAAAVWESAGQALRSRQRAKGDGDADASAPANGKAEAAASAADTAAVTKDAAQATWGGPAVTEAVTHCGAPSDTAADAVPVEASAGTGAPQPELVLEVADGDLRPANTNPSFGAASSPSVGAALAISRPEQPQLPQVLSGLPPSLQPPLRALAVAARDGDLVVDVAAGAVLLTLTGVSLAYAYLDRHPPTSADRQFWWFSILLGPPGCFLRWYLSRFNGVRGGWMQYGTFAANVLGCLLVFVCDVLQFRLAGSLGHAQRMALRGLMVGTAGCLTTVSTYVVEIQKLALTSPAGAYKYFLASTVVPVGLGLLVYGIPVWLA